MEMTRCMLYEKELPKNLWAEAASTAVFLLNRPDIIFAVSMLSRFMHCASEVHLQAVKRIVRYVKGTVDYGVKYTHSQNFQFHVYSDSDWGGSIDDMKSTTAEAEYVTATAVVNQAIWLRRILADLHMEQKEPTQILVDNQAVISISNNHTHVGICQVVLCCVCSTMAKKPVKYFVVDAFTESAFKGNPAAVCLLEEEKEDSWMQGVATEFNLSETCYLTPIAESERSDISLNRFRLRWFTPATEVELCGHATLASAHVLFSSGLVKSDIIEFVTLSGVLTAKKVSGINDGEGASEDGLFIELEFPADTVTEFNSADISQISAALNDAPIIDIKRTTVGDHLLVELASGKDVVELQPDIGAIAKCPGGGILVSGTAPPESGFDYYCRTFFPKVGINEDPITGSAQCALAPYWAKKMGKWDLSVYAASPRGGVVHVHFDDQSKRILMRGKAVTVMNGCVMI
ncbi:putative isomerase BH0283 isoform B [Glycine soja]|uniref:Putative isomerase BH0283 isoform B n=2 Tax=Glycine soja TaxID=3848 RepID=A0A445IGW0_GLYSO|nr:putative isomerase BH0283 isoform B [Glycine soja]